MKPPATDAPISRVPAPREKTGKTLPLWFSVLDGLGGVARGRRELVTRLCSEEQSRRDADELRAGRGGAFELPKSHLEGS